MTLAAAVDLHISPYTVIIVVTIVIAVLVFIGALWFIVGSARRVRRFAASNDIVPGHPSSAPQSWVRSGEPAALIHRRLRYAVALVHQLRDSVTTSNSTTLPDDVAAALARFDEAAIAVDEQLVAANTSGADLTQYDWATTIVERLPGKLALANARDAVEHIDAAVSYMQNPSTEPDPNEAAYSADDIDGTT